MNKNSKLWSDLNTLLSQLRNVPDIVDQYYINNYGNDAPGYLLREQIKKLQKHLDEAKP